MFRDIYEELNYDFASKWDDTCVGGDAFCLDEPIYLYHLTTKTHHEFKRNFKSRKKMCTAPNVLQCILGIGYWDTTNFTLYRTKNKISTFTFPDRECDFVLTQEMIIYPESFDDLVLVSEMSFDNGFYFDIPDNSIVPIQLDNYSNNKYYPNFLERAGIQPCITNK